MSFILLATVLGKLSHAVDDLDSVQDSKHTKTVPSQMSKLPNHEPLQRQPTERIKILDDRPEPDPVPPVSLLYDGFGYFMDDVFRSREGVSDVSRKRRDLELAVNVFADEMTGFYCNDASRSFGGLHALNDIFALGDGKKFRAVDINTALSDSDHDKPYDGASCLVWFKNEFVNIGSSPMVALATYAARSRDLVLMQHFKGADSCWRTPFLGLTVIGELNIWAFRCL